MKIVMPGPVPGIHGLPFVAKAWMVGTSQAMTTIRDSGLTNLVR